MVQQKSKSNPANPVVVSFKIHPRVFKALGADLVTNDAVAIIELVKNAYDAYATQVEIRFIQGKESQLLEIEDNGSGMDRTVIEDAWCTVATDYRRQNPTAKRPGRRNRRTSGEKGLGRLSAARLGSGLEMLTQTESGKCWKVVVDWDQLARADSLEQCVATITPEPNSPLKKSGTLLRITPLRSVWSDATIDDLRDNLARLLPPFETKDSFTIKLGRPGLFEDAIDIEAPSFLFEPKYSISGDVTADGKVRFSYEFDAIKGQGHREVSDTITWHEICDSSRHPMLEKAKEPEFGPFKFEIRGWDIAPDDTQEIADRFEIKKASIRKDIKAYKGISVYRDGILVLPKSEGARDWLGLDLRRVGRVGPRLSTTQLVGYVAISARDNPRLEDTSDRERLASTPAVIAFEETLRAIVSRMENEREKDRRETTKEKRVVELFARLNARDLIAGISEVAREGGPASEALPLVEDFSHKLDQARHEIENRFVYYSRLASIGTIAHYLVHEIRNRTTVLGNVFETIAKKLESMSDKKFLASKLDAGVAALTALDTLADKFAPLANRQFRRRMRSACLEESVLSCLVTLARDLEKHKIKVSTPSDSVTLVAIDPGELEIVLYNLFANAIYWLAHDEKDSRHIEVRTRKLRGGKRVQVEIHDSGPGVSADDAAKIFWPGVTNKPDGIGMGLTVASELVSEYGGRLGLDRKGRLGGASFIFDVPLKEPGKLR